MRITRFERDKKVPKPAKLCILRLIGFVHKTYRHDKQRAMRLQPALKTIPVPLTRPVIIGPDLSHGFPDVSNVTDFKT